MKAIEILDHFKMNSSWVNWDKTVDRLLFGDSNAEVNGIAVSWMPTFSNLEEALKYKCNVFITHEPLFAARIDEEGNIIDSPVINDPHSRWVIGKRKLKQGDVWIKKMEWLEQHKLVVIRCHDYWDNYPDIGVHRAWAKALGFTDPPIKIENYYELHKIPETTLWQLSRRILEKIKKIGQDSIQVIGDLEKKLSSIVIGTGAATHYREMSALGGDAILLSEDGTFLWESGQWALDTGNPIIIVNHSLSEEPGMLSLAEYLESVFPTVPVKHIPVGCIFKSIY
ncbi:MAG: Nif3-like dinuclear metal center hexameric protein [Candidatus Thorarchaeota archaeon]